MEEALKLVACTSSAGLDNRYSVGLGFLNRNNQGGLVKMKKKKKKKQKEKVGVKKKLKSLKGLSKDLSAISGLRSAVDRDQNLLAQVRDKMIMEAAEALMKQLQQLKTEEKELNKKRKQDKAKLKQKQGSACGSDSSDSESEEEGLINEDVKKEESVPNLGTNSDGMTTLTKKRVEVCMGNKCKKSGGGALLEEFQRAIGGEGDVVGCKCLGKCRDGPNIRLFNSAAYAAAYDLTPANPLYVGVGLQDVGVIASKFFAQDKT